jgi:hypothetical protein
MIIPHTHAVPTGVNVTLLVFSHIPNEVWRNLEGVQPSGASYLRLSPPGQMTTCRFAPCKPKFSVASLLTRMLHPPKAGPLLKHDAPTSIQSRLG